MTALMAREMAGELGLGKSAVWRRTQRHKSGQIAAYILGSPGRLSLKFLEHVIGGCADFVACQVLQIRHDWSDF